jgi:hypothetical protein
MAPKKKGIGLLVATSVDQTVSIGALIKVRLMDFGAGVVMTVTFPVGFLGDCLGCLFVEAAPFKRVAANPAYINQLKWHPVPLRLMAKQHCACGLHN